MRRTEARELLMKMLYQMEAQNDFSVYAKDTFEENFFSDEDQKEYFEEVFNSFVYNKEAVDSLIEAHSNGWKLPRIAKVDLSILRLSISEFKFSDLKDVDEATSIDEAVKLAKEYGSEKSPKFINGVLGSIAREK